MLEEEEEEEDSNCHDCNASTVTFTVALVTASEAVISSNQSSQVFTYFDFC